MPSWVVKVSRWEGNWYSINNLETFITSSPSSFESETNTSWQAMFLLEDQYKQLKTIKITSLSFIFNFWQHLFYCFTKLNQRRRTKIKSRNVQNKPIVWAVIRLFSRIVWSVDSIAITGLWERSQIGLTTRFLFWRWNRSRRRQRPRTSGRKSLTQAY